VTAASSGDETLSGIGTDVGTRNEIIAGSGADTLTGTGYYDTLVGGSSADTLIGGWGNETYVVNNANDVVIAQPDGYSNTILTNVSYTAPDNVQTLSGYGNADITLTAGAQTSVIYANSGNDILSDGGHDGVIMYGNTGNDTFIVSNSDDVVTNSNDEVNVYTPGANSIYTIKTSASYAAPDNVQILNGTGSADITLTAGYKCTLVTANAGNDTLIADDDGVALIGGLGNDVITNTGASSFIAAAGGNTTITSGNQSDVLAFNTNWGQASVTGVDGATGVLSFGGGLDLSNLSFVQSGNDLVLSDGTAGDSLTLTDWYADVQDITTLQVIEAASPTYNTGMGAMSGNKVETYDFAVLVNAFNQAQAGSASPWSLMNGMLDAHLGGSDTAALGGDLAFQYGMAQPGTIPNLAAVSGQVRDEQFGKVATTLA
jgi:Ca2+-binding RTX toxin-like protein